VLRANKVIPIRTLDDLYSAVDELITELNSLNRTQLAGALRHRLHIVAWTTGSELIEELRSLLSEALSAHEEPLSLAAEQKIQRILTAMERYTFGQKGTG
jgi:hypothetical protein